MRVVIAALAVGLLGAVVLAVLWTPLDHEVSLAAAPVPQARAYAGDAATVFNTPTRNPWLADGPWRSGLPRWDCSSACWPR